MIHKANYFRIDTYFNIYIIRILWGKQNKNDWTTEKWFNKIVNIQLVLSMSLL